MQSADFVCTSSEVESGGVSTALVRAAWIYRKEYPMLWTIFVILMVMWLLGLVTSYTLGGFIHILLVIALVVLVLRLIRGRGPVV
jgi:hypothetical protein